MLLHPVKRLVVTVNVPQLNHRRMSLHQTNVFLLRRRSVIYTRLRRTRVEHTLGIITGVLLPRRHHHHGYLHPGPCPLTRPRLP